jgi:hypothetical protein
MRSKCAGVRFGRSAVSEARSQPRPELKDLTMRLKRSNAKRKSSRRGEMEIKWVCEDSLAVKFEKTMLKKASSLLNSIADHVLSEMR